MILFDIAEKKGKKKVSAIKRFKALGITWLVRGGWVGWGLGG